MKLGNFKIHYLNGGITNIDGGAMFGVVPKVLWAKNMSKVRKIGFHYLHIQF